MSEAQLVTLMFTAPFLALSITYGIGLYLFERSERISQKLAAERIKDRERRQ